MNSDIYEIKEPWRSAHTMFKISEISRVGKVEWGGYSMPALFFKDGTDIALSKETAEELKQILRQL